MAIDDTSVTEGYTTNPSEGSGHGPKFIAIFLVLAALAIGEIYTLSQLSSIHSSVQNEQARVQKDIGVQLEDQISSRLSAIQRSPPEPTRFVPVPTTFFSASNCWSPS